MKILILLLLTLFLSVGTYAQKDVTVETSFFYSTAPNVENLPLPEYPKIAKQAGLTGKVSVQVTLDEKGNVVLADTATGPYPLCQSVTDLPVTMLRNSALEAAKKARFRPIDGQVTGDMKGRIIYDFGIKEAVGSTDDKKTTGTPTEMRLDRMTILGSSDSNTGARIVAPGEPITTNKDESALHKTVSGGVLNGKASSLAKPTFPAAARAVRASGTVVVQVLIAEDGGMYSAQAVSGHPLLRASSEVAACGTRFAPTLLDGKPVKVSGVITYNYIP